MGICCVLSNLMITWNTVLLAYEVQCWHNSYDQSLSYNWLMVMLLSLLMHRDSLRQTSPFLMSAWPQNKMSSLWLFGFCYFPFLRFMLVALFCKRMLSRLLDVWGQMCFLSRDQMPRICSHSSFHRPPGSETMQFGFMF